MTAPVVQIASAAGGVFLAVAVLWDMFETVLMTRRIEARFRFSRLVLRAMWAAWSAVAGRLRPRGVREHVMAMYAILALMVLLGVWAVGLVVAFALLQWSVGASMATPGEPVTFGTALYFSGSSFLTLGLGDVRPVSALARALTVLEAAIGFGSLAMIVSYLPVLYAAFSGREARITMLDEWAGSPPCAAVALRRNAESPTPDAIVALLRDWELSAAELLESQVSYPILTFFRSQHDNQSWLAALTAVLDTCALVLVGVEGVPTFQARLTFAMARHTAVDLRQVLRRPADGGEDRLPPAEFARLRAWLADAGVPFARGEDAERRLAELRAMYEPSVVALSRYLRMPLPGWLPPERILFNWEKTVWALTGDDAPHDRPAPRR